MEWKMEGEKHEEVKAVITCSVFYKERSEILFFLLTYRHSITAEMSMPILRTG